MKNFLIYDIITWINDLPSKGVVTSPTSPATAVLVKSNTYYENKLILLRAYTLVYIRTTNIMKISSVPTIALKESN